MKELCSLTRYFIMIIILSHFSFSSTAQKKKYAGFIVNAHGDTITGFFPQYKQWTNNPDNIIFISSQSGQQEILTPAMCQQFHIDGYETYIAFHGKRMTNPIVFNQPDSEDDSDRYDTIATFLREFAVGASCKFYIFKDKNRFNLYYSSTDGVVTELLQKVYVTENHSIQLATYKQQLQLLFPNRTEQINHLLYSEESLAAFIRKQKNENIAIKKEPRQNGGLYISGGLSRNSLKFSPDASMGFSQKKYESQNVPLVSIGYIFAFSRNFSRIFFLPQIKTPHSNIWTRYRVMIFTQFNQQLSDLLRLYHLVFTLDIILLIILIFRYLLLPGQE